jgi:hypothetical protein
MFTTPFQRFESDALRLLNAFTEPIARSPLGALPFSPVGLIIVETIGRTTGNRIDVQLAAMFIDDLVVVSTIRSRSDWVKNLSANSSVRYWLRGKEHYAQAFTIGRGIESPEGLPQKMTCLAAALRQHSELFGTAFAILAPGTTAS